MCAPLQVCKTPDQCSYAVAAMTACQLDELHAMSWGGRQIRLGGDQAENYSSEEDSCSQSCLTFSDIGITFFASHQAQLTQTKTCETSCHAFARCYATARCHVMVCAVTSTTSGNHSHYL
jgi:hypothetical protein